MRALSTSHKDRCDTHHKSRGACARSVISTAADRSPVRSEPPRSLPNEVNMKKLILSLLSVGTLYATVCMAGNWVSVPAGTSAELARRLEHARWIPAGAKQSARVVYVFTDPNCPYCNDLWKSMKSARDPAVQIRYLLVAVIDDSSRGKDGSILESQDPAAALDKHERDFANGGITPKPALQPATGQAIRSNEELMGALQIVGTPGLVYFDEHKQMKAFSGMPDAQQLHEIVGGR